MHGRSLDRSIICTLPIGLLAHIFLHFFYDNHLADGDYLPQRGPVGLMMVCKAFCDVALRTPALWPGIHF